jgi:putative endonuclease
MRTYWTYILASRSRRLYIGVTNNLLRRLHQHRTEPSGFCARYRTVRLVYFESASSPRDAIAREKQLKGWRREKKVALIEEWNAGWLDLAADSLPAPGHPERSEGSASGGVRTPGKQVPRSARDDKARSG